MPGRLSLSLLAVCAFAALTLGACGNKKSVVTSASSEGIYLDVDSLKYQVQVSRELNPSDREDRSYMVGLAPADRSIAPDEVWFGVFLRVQNDSGKSHPAAQQFQIEDTEHNVYKPVPLASINTFAYRPLTLAPKDLIPQPDTPAYDGPTQGAMILFKLKEPSFDNRPLVLSIESAVTPGESAHVDLDV